MSLIPNVENGNSQGALLNPSSGFFYNIGPVFVPAGSTFSIPIANAPFANQITPFVPSPSSVTLNRSGVYRINITISMAPDVFTNTNYIYEIYPVKNGVSIILPTGRNTSVSRSGVFAFSTADAVLSSAEWLEQCIAGDTIEAVVSIVSAVNFNLTGFSMTIQQIE